MTSPESKGLTALGWEWPKGCLSCTSSRADKSIDPVCAGWIAGSVTNTWSSPLKVLPRRINRTGE